MKKILATIVGLAVGASLVHAQGFLQLTSGISFGITTNTGAFGNPTVPNAPYSSIISGKTTGSATTPGQFDYAFLFIPTGVGSSGDLSNLNSGNWVQLAVDLGGTPGLALAGTNTASAGNFAAQNGANSVSSIGIGGQAFNSGTTYSLAIVGWTSSLGSSWSTVSQELSTGVWAAPGNFGFDVASVNPSSGTPGNLPTAMWGNNSLVLYSVPVPEPTTLALAGLGGLSLLFLRRRKS